MSSFTSFSGESRVLNRLDRRGPFDTRRLAPAEIFGALFFSASVGFASSKALFGQDA